MSAILPHQDGDRTHASRVRILVGLNRKMLLEFGRRTATRLRSALPLRHALPHLESVLALNIEKEVHKDALVIAHAGDAVAKGVGVASRETLLHLLESSKQIDRTFLSRVNAFPVGIVIHYKEIEPLRLKRIEHLHTATCAVLTAWRTAPNLRAAVQASFPNAELEGLLLQVLRLYALETRALSRSVRLPALLAPARDMLAEKLFRVMNESAMRLAADLSHGFYVTAQSLGADARRLGKTSSI